MIRLGFYHGVPCRIIPWNGDNFVLEFKDLPFKYGENFPVWPGKNRSDDDPPEVMAEKYYRYYYSAIETEGVLVLEKFGYQCVECNTGNELAQANLSRDRFICWGCSSSYRWKYDGEFLPGHRFHRKVQEK